MPLAWNYVPSCSLLARYTLEKVIEGECSRKHYPLKTRARQVLRELLRGRGVEGISAAGLESAASCRSNKRILADAIDEVEQPGGLPPVSVVTLYRLSTSHTNSE